MKFKSQIITQASGSIGGITASHNRGGMYFRARSIPTNPGTSFQTAVRNIMTSLVTYWTETLTAAQRTSWNVYAANVPRLDTLGESRLITGQQTFISYNTPRIQAGLPQVDDGPTIYDRGDFDNTLTVNASASTDDVVVTFDNGLTWANEDDAALLVYSSMPQNASVNYFKGPYRFAGKVDGDSVTPPTSPAAISSPYALTAGQKVFSKLSISYADGRLTSPFRFSSTVT